MTRNYPKWLNAYSYLLIIGGRTEFQFELTNNMTETPWPKLELYRS